MPFIPPGYSRSQVNKAGMILANPEAYSSTDQKWADEVLANWRACHGYPINTFQATLRTKLKAGPGEHIVAQRLKRAPSIIAKLQRFDGMQLARMQDIGGLRAIIGSVDKVRHLIKGPRIRRTPLRGPPKQRRPLLVCARGSPNWGQVPAKDR